MIIPDSNKIPRWLLAFIVFVFVFGIAATVWIVKKKSPNFSFSENSSYLVPGVPYIGVYNHKGDYNQFSNDEQAAIATVLEYWNPGQNKLENIINGVGTGISFSKYEKFVSGIKGMKAEDKVLTLDQLSSYISPQARTPLVAFFAIDESQPMDNDYYPARVLIGINQKEKKITFHDYLQGNNFEISFDEYNKLMEKTPPVFRNKYLIVQPTDLGKALEAAKSRPSVPYPARTQSMDKAGPIFTYWALANKPYINRQFDAAINYYTAAINSPGFEEFFPPEYKTRVYAQLADMQFGKGDQGDANKDIQTAQGLNHDLDQPFGDWPGYETGSSVPGHVGESSIPYRVEGDMYLALGNFAKAKENYSKALEIKPANTVAQAGLAKAVEALSKK